MLEANNASRLEARLSKICPITGLQNARNQITPCFLIKENSRRAVHMVVDPQSGGDQVLLTRLTSTHYDFLLLLVVHPGDVKGLVWEGEAGCAGPRAWG